MQITNCKLSKRVQKKLLEFFVLQVTARSAADILDIQPNSAILFYRKIRIIHHRINHSKEFADRQNHINGIENFWNQAKRVLRKYNGIDRKSFPLFLKECEFRFNFGTPSQQLKILRDWCGI
ncbi:transposase [Eikenella corrodens]|uniref:transposase n=1 Tax=Eikenella corrodens TaxID=539 RepID=UPI00129A6228|nr:transposase [Eikenella corrodens]